MKEVTQSGGLVSLEIPAAWIAEEDEHGTLVMYEGHGSDTLRLDILTARPPNSIVLTSAAEALCFARGKQLSDVVTLSNGNALLKHREHTVEDGTAIVITYWEVAHLDKEGGLCLAIFSLTSEAVNISSADCVATNELCEQQIRKAVFSE